MPAPSGGVIMHLADEAQPQELRLKGGPGGKNYIGPPGPGGSEKDREIVSFDGRVMQTRFVDPRCQHPLRHHGVRPLRAARVKRDRDVCECGRVGHFISLFALRIRKRPA